MLYEVAFNEWQFFASNDLDEKKIKKNKPLVCFGSFQDYLGKNKSGNIKLKNENTIKGVGDDAAVIDMGDKYQFMIQKKKMNTYFKLNQV